MSIALQARVSELEREVKSLREVLDGLISQIATPPPHNPNGPRQMCPKCGEKPNYYLHTKNCKGKGAPI